jgi:hypothetical protein
MKLAIPSRALAKADASKRFGRYKQEPEHCARPAEVVGGELRKLRQRRELLRGMSPKQALQVIEFHNDLNVFEALALAKKEGKILVPNYVHDRILTETKERYSAWTGTCVIYEAPDKPFGEKVVYRWEDYNGIGYSIRLAVPEHLRGKTNCALVIEHPDFGIVVMGNSTYELEADEKTIALIENFPKESGKWHEFDERFRIPVGSQKRKNKSLRRLWRLDDSYLGPVARGFYDRRVAFLIYGPSVGYGVAVF